MMKKLLTVLGLLLLTAASAAAQTCSNYPYVFVNGQTADATQVNANFNAILNCVNSELAPINSPTFTGTPAAPTPGSNIATSQLATTLWVNNWFAPLNSPAFTGIPTAPTASVGTNTTQIATAGLVYNSFRANEGITASTTISSSNQSTYDGTTLYLDASTGNQTLTVNALSTLGNNQFTLRVCNEDTNTHVWNVASADAGTIQLYPQQCNALIVNNGASLVYLLPAVQPYGGTPILYLSASGSDSNDGLTSSAPMATFTHVLSVFKSRFAYVGTSFQIVPAAGTYTENVSCTGFPSSPSEDVSINPSGAITLNPLSSGSPAVFGRDGCILTLNGSSHTITISCGVGGGVNPTQGSVIDITGTLTASACPGGVILAAADGGHINQSGTVNVSGNFSVLAQSLDPGSLITMSGIVDFTTTVTGSVTFQAGQTGVINTTEGLGITWQNTGNATITDACLATTAGGVYTAGQEASVPGTQGCSAGASSPGWVN